MIATNISNIDNCNPCKYCGELPKLITQYYEDGDKQQQISCQTDKAICTAFSYVKVNYDIKNSIDEWNKINEVEINKHELI